jgi:hypothetical protein
MITFYTFAHKRPDFLQFQLDSFRKHVSGGFEFVVFNNAVFDVDRSGYHDIQALCAANAIRVIDIQHDSALVDRLTRDNGEAVFDNDGLYRNAVIACAYPLCWAWEHVISRTNDMICIIDSDMFFIADENPTEALNTSDVIYVEHSRGLNGDVYYMWNGLVYMHLAHIPEKASIDWWCGTCEGHPVDVGGHTYYWLRRHKDQLKVKLIRQLHVGEDPECNFSPANYEYLAMNDVWSVLHFRGGSGWHLPGHDYTARKTAWLKSKLHGS